MDEKISSIVLALYKLQGDDNTPAWAKVLISSVADLISVFKSNCELNERVSELETENENLKVELANVKQAADCNEQKSRNINLLIHGIEEADEENTDQLCLDVIKNSVGVDISMNDIERTHRIGVKRKQTVTRNSKPKHRPLIVRFASMRTRMEVFRNKKALKGKSFSITESLTAYRYNLLLKAKAKFSLQNCWTSEWRILAKDGNKITVVQSESDLT